MTNTQKQKINAINKLQKANILLLDSLILIQNINKKDQFDYVTDSALSNALDGCLHISKKIDKIVYQK